MSKIRIAFGAVVLALLVACGTPTPAPTTRPTTANPTSKAPTPTTPTTPSRSPATPQDISAEQRNATETAVSYLDGQAFSRKGLIKQLKYEGYSTKAATAAVDSLNVDWNAQAVLVAQNYLSNQPFSRKGLVAQLEYEGFTAAQAAHGVKGAGL